MCRMQLISRSLFELKWEVFRGLPISNFFLKFPKDKPESVMKQKETLNAHLEKQKSEILLD